jgi:hypothetical protein
VATNRHSAYAPLLRQALSAAGEGAAVELDIGCRLWRRAGCHPTARGDRGVQSGVQIERNCPQLRATRTRSRQLNPLGHAWIVPAGGRAVAGSNPVSPMLRKARKCGPFGFSVRGRGRRDGEQTGKIVCSGGSVFGRGRSERREAVAWKRAPLCQARLVLRALARRRRPPRQQEDRESPSARQERRDHESGGRAWSAAARRGRGATTSAIGSGAATNCG